MKIHTIKRTKFFSPSIMKTRFYTTLFLLIVFFQMEAQEEFNMAGITYTFNPAVSLENPSNQQLQETEINLSEFKAFFLAPIRLKNDKTILRSY